MIEQITSKQVVFRQKFLISTPSLLCLCLLWSTYISSAFAQNSDIDLLKIKKISTDLTKIADTLQKSIATESTSNIALNGNEGSYNYDGSEPEMYPVLSNSLRTLPAENLFFYPYRLSNFCTS